MIGNLFDYMLMIWGEMFWLCEIVIVVGNDLLID